MEAATLTAAPPTAPQHMKALAHANRIRLARAAWKRDIRAGRVTVPDLLREPPIELDGMTVGALIGAQQRWADRRTAKFLADFAISPMRRIDRLTARQREVLAAALARKVGGSPNPSTSTATSTSAVA